MDLRWCVVVIVVVVSESYASDCTAGVTFLRTSSNGVTTQSPGFNSTYTVPISYPCDGDVLVRIERLREKVKDPYVSFYLKKRRGVKRVKRVAEYGSGDYDDDNEDDEDDDDEGEEDEGEEIEEYKTVEPSERVIPVVPTPSLGEIEFASETPVLSSRNVGMEISSYIGRESIAPTRSFYPTHSYTHRPTTEDDNLLFPVLGSGDGPVVMTTPVFNPTDNPTSASPYYTSTWGPTPALTAHLLHPIQKQLIYSGVQHKLVIPVDTFQPPCFNYALLDNNENWVDVKGTVVRFFPVTAHISDYNLRLECKEYGVGADLFVSVRQRQKSRLWNHEFVIEFGMIRGNYSRVEVLERVVEEVRGVVGGGGNSSDLVVSSFELDTYPFRVRFVNETLISNVCPVDELKRIYEALGRVNGFVKVEGVRVIIPPNNQCDQNVVAEVTGEGSGGKGGVMLLDYKPSIKNQIDRVNGSVGEYLVYGVKEDFCYDPEDGGTRSLRVELKDNELQGIDENVWLQFDVKNQEFYGLPLNEEVLDLVLTCSDRTGKQANDVLEVVISKPRIPPSSYNTEFSLHFQSIPFTPKAIRKFIEKLSQVLSPQIHVNSFHESNNHVLFKWFNTSNPSTEHEVTEIRKVLLSDDGPVNKRLYEHFTPEFNVTVASVVPLRGLLSENNPVDEKVDGDGGRYFDFDNKQDGGVSGGGGGSEGGGGKMIDTVINVDNYSGYLTTYIIPSVLIAVMILLALFIACLLSRKNKYTQASTEDDSPNARVYLKNAKKGVPVIFQDELDEKLFSNGGSGQRGNIYEQNTPRSQAGTPQQRPPPRNDSSSTGMQSPRVISPQPTHPSRGYPQPPDYQNSISRSMMRNRGLPMSGLASPPPIGGVPVFPNNQHPMYERPHHVQNPNIDSYAPPPGINYYGIHNSNSAASFSSGGAGGNFQGVGGHHHGGNKHGIPQHQAYVPP